MTAPSSPSSTALKPGDPAPDVALRDARGAEVFLSSRWQTAPKALALVFVRHFG